MSKKVKCSNCGESKWLMYHHYNDNLVYWKVTSLDDLNKVYLCRKCRKLLKPSSLRETPEFKELQHVLQEEVNQAIRRNINLPIVRENFLKNVKIILDKRLIKKYSFQVTDNELKGIVLEQLPFFGNVLVQLKNKKGIYG
jgi:tRNA nucleotidyltransferase/poly(A) polymerase